VSFIGSLDATKLTPFIFSVMGEVMAQEDNRKYNPILKIVLITNI
jgi:hypothetical protein